MLEQRRRPRPNIPPVLWMNMMNATNNIQPIAQTSSCTDCRNSPFVFTPPLLYLDLSLTVSRPCQAPPFTPLPSSLWIYHCISHYIKEVTYYVSSLIISSGTRIIAAVSRALSILYNGLGSITSFSSANAFLRVWIISFVCRTEISGVAIPTPMNCAVLFIVYYVHVIWLFLIR